MDFSNGIYHLQMKIHICYQYVVMKTNMIIKNLFIVDADEKFCFPIKHCLKYLSSWNLIDKTDICGYITV